MVPVLIYEKNRSVHMLEKLVDNLRFKYIEFFREKEL